MDHHPSLTGHGKVKDPVCGMDVDPATARFSHEHAGQAFHFCSSRCLEKFKTEPAKFLQPAPSAAHAHAPLPAPAVTPPTMALASPSARQYTCPMHPEIIRDAPGACPICGMALEPMMPGEDDEPNHELIDFSRRFWWTLPLSVVVLVLAMFGHQLTTPDPRTRVLIEMVLSTPVVLWAGWPFFVRCVQSLRTGNLNMWTLIGIGVGSAYGYSLAAALAPELFPAAFHVHGQVGVYCSASCSNCARDRKPRRPYAPC
jgi:P-type Cu+ transporter